MGSRVAERQDFPETNSKSSSRPSPFPTLGGQGTCVSTSKSPFAPSSHCLRGPLPQPCTPSRLSSWDQWLTPTEGFEEASGLGHIPHPPSRQDSHSCGCQGLRAGWGAHCCPSFHLLVTGHTTQEPSQAHAVLQIWCQGRQAQVGQGPLSQIWKGKAGIWAFSGSVCLSLSSLPTLPFHLTLLFQISLHLTYLSICICKPSCCLFGLPPLLTLLSFPFL